MNRQEEERKKYEKSLIEEQIHFEAVTEQQRILDSIYLRQEEERKEEELSLELIKKLYLCDSTGAVSEPLGETMSSDRHQPRFQGFGAVNYGVESLGHRDKIKEESKERKKRRKETYPWIAVRGRRGR